MDLSQKLQELRKAKGLTQEELASALFVSRTAVSKWESGRGYPSIDSLRSIASYFSITLDELLSTSEVVTLAEKEQAQRKSLFLKRMFGFLDIASASLFFLPLFASRTAQSIQASSLLSLVGVPLYVKALFFVFVALTVVSGILMLALQSTDRKSNRKTKYILSLSLSTAAAMLFILARHPYAAFFLSSLNAIKAIMLIKQK